MCFPPIQMQNVDYYFFFTQNLFLIFISAVFVSWTITRRNKSALRDPANCDSSVSSFPVFSPVKLKPEPVTEGQVEWSLTRSPPFGKRVRLSWRSWEKPGEDFIKWEEKLQEWWRPSFFICPAPTVIRRPYSEGSAGQVRHSVNPFKLIMSFWMCRHKERVSEWKRHICKVTRNKVKSRDLPSIHYHQVKISICLMSWKKSIS